ncbi:lysozyme C-3-like [Ambystoma mexicanum]|uniref:lysozyme C-3-like n=1 Tax=Ambystoma mexicanum TaxID=8296 RepID=UPI0037E7BFAF
MRTLGVIALLVLVGTHCKIVDRCALARAAVDGGLRENAANLVCLAAYASKYDTSLHRLSTDFGVFQINSEYWCDDYTTIGRKNLCGIPCSTLLDDCLCDDMKCVARILQEPEGFESWDPWKKYCKDKDLSSYLENCTLS